MDATQVTPAIHCKNESYWIHYVLRDLFKVFGRVVMLDTGSNDFTAEYATYTANEFGGELNLTIEDMGNDAVKIGQCSTRLREMIETPWMFLVDGDEIWLEEQLLALLDIFDPAPDTEVGMVRGRNVTLIDNQLMERDVMVADRLFSPSVRWEQRSDYPFQSHGLENRCASGRVQYLDFDKVWYWHMRHVPRSQNDGDAFFRQTKRDYYPYDGEYVPLPDGWLGEINQSYPNPMLGVGTW